MSLQYSLPLPLGETMRAEDFLIAPSNDAAATWLLRLDPSAWPSHCLILYGPHGCGKTHLLSVWKEKHGAYLLSPRDDCVADIVAGSTPWRAFAFEGADRLAGSAQDEEWLQHLYNATKAANAPLLLTALAPPSAWRLALKDIDSRLKSCMAVEVGEPDDGLVRGLLLKQFADRQLLVEPDVIDYLVPRLERTGSAVRAIVRALDQQALAQRRKITVPFAQEVMGGMVAGKEPLEWEGLDVESP